MPATWSRYIAEFFLTTVFFGGQVRQPGPDAPGSYRNMGPASMNMGNREDLRASMKESGSTHRALATPRHFWRCRSCGEKGGIFDDYVLREPGDW
jgi:hypothetical protein